MSSTYYLVSAVIAGACAFWATTLFWRSYGPTWLRRRLLDGCGAESVGRRTRATAGIIASVVLGVAALGASEVMRYRWSGPDSWSVVAARWTTLLLLFHALGVVFIAFRYDPANGKLRCGSCWHEATGAPGSACPECGARLGARRLLTRTRRRPWLLCWSALCMLGAYASFASLRIVERGAGGAVPTTILVVGWPWSASIPVSLHERVRYDGVWSWQHDLLAWRCARVIERSSSINDIQNSIDMFRLLEPNRRLPKAGDAGQVAVVQHLCMSRSSAGVSWWALLPEEFNAEVSLRVQPVLSTAILSADDEVARAAMTCAGRLDVLPGDLRDELFVRVQASESNEQVVETAAGALKHASLKEAPGVRERHLQLFASQNDRVRRVACDMATAGAPDVRPYVRRSLTDPSDAVVRQAARALVRLEGCATSDAIAPLVRRRDPAGRHLMDALATNCPEADTVHLFESLLASDDALVRGSAAASSGRLGGAGAPLIEALQRLAQQDADGITREAAQRSLRAIRSAIE